jgi:flagellar biosynthesis/type III secretory pathway M-ring protein FliF/YscJ
MNVFNRRNALVGFITLKAASRALERRRRRRRFGGGLRVAAFVVLGLVSLGILAGVVAVYLRRRQQEQEPRRLEGYAVAEEAGEEASGESATATAEPIPAT